MKRTSEAKLNCKRGAQLEYQFSISDYIKVISVNKKPGLFIKAYLNRFFLTSLLLLIEEISSPLVRFANARVSFGRHFPLYPGDGLL